MNKFILELELKKGPQNAKHEYLLPFTIVILLHNIFGLSNIIYFPIERFMVDVIKTKAERPEYNMNNHGVSA